jgi:hypothetical protein
VFGRLRSRGAGYKRPSPRFLSRGIAGSRPQWTPCTHLLAASPSPSSPRSTLIDEVERQAALLTTVATGGADFRDKHLQRQYKDRRRRLVDALEQRGLAYPFPWQDLPQWHGYWTVKNLRTLE